MKGAVIDGKGDVRFDEREAPFKGQEVSLNSLSDLIVKLALTPEWRPDAVWE
jgi:hypothetical protein